MRYQNSKFLHRNSDFLTLQTLEFKKKIRPVSSESKMESEFCLQWESQKSEPKIGIPNLGKGGKGGKSGKGGKGGKGSEGGKGGKGDKGERARAREDKGQGHN
jgi:hypothetical protein